jgi:hypothetical protein
MVVAMTDAPALRKRGRPRAGTDNQQGPEVGICRTTIEQAGTDSRNPETSKAAT